jgi:peroxiredoxin
MTSSDYNFKHHKTEIYDMKELDGPKVGEKASDFLAMTIDGHEVRLSDYYGKILVLENGSITCPQFVGNIKPMNQLAEDFPNVEFLVLYTREAHPGERIGAHQTLEDKFQRARETQDRFGEERQILVDSLEGTGHLAYGTLPDMVYIIAPDGIVAFRGKWNNAEAIRTILEKLTKNESIEGLRSPFRIPPLAANIKAVMPAGFGAVMDLMVCAPKVMWVHLKEELEFAFKS